MEQCSHYHLRSEAVEDEKSAAQRAMRFLPLRFAELK